jgi:hypothetical protein
MAFMLLLSDIAVVRYRLQLTLQMFALAKLACLRWSLSLGLLWVQMPLFMSLFVQLSWKCSAH